MLGLAFANTFFFFKKNDLLAGNRRLLRKALGFINTSSTILHEYQVAFFPHYLPFANTKETGSFPARFNLQALLQHICQKEVQRLSSTLSPIY